MVRGADRKTFPVAIISKLLKVKFVFFAASDVNFVPGKELIHGVKLNRRLYQKSIRHIPYIVVQNTYQQQTLLDNYGKNCLTMPNIWRGEADTMSSQKHIDVIWIANFRRLKRAEWMVEAARRNPQLHFALIGRPSAEKDYYQQIEHDCSELDNVTFYGPLGFDETNALVSQSKILACTSEFEGFPNTFLQAWAYTIPVVSTVDPSYVIAQNNLGLVVENENGFNAAILHLLEDENDYENKCISIKAYFCSNHSSNTNFSKLMTYIQE
jgi:glycosyltransferase involved in cell wall biosynthesis